MINPDELRAAFAAIGPAAVRRNLAAGLYAADVQAIAMTWLDDQDSRASTRLETLIAQQHRLAAVTFGVALIAAISATVTLLLVAVPHLHR